MEPKMRNPQHHHRHHHHKQTGELIASENAQSNVQVEDSAIQPLAYQIYCEKGGPALDNWLEAEQALRNNR